MIINMRNQYRTVSGLPVRILCVDAKLDDQHNVAGIADGELMRWDRSGRNPYCEDLNLVVFTPYDNFKVGQLVMVYDCREQWYMRKFAGVDSDGNPLSWLLTPTGEKITAAWDDCREPTARELLTRGVDE